MWRRSSKTTASSGRRASTGSTTTCRRCRRETPAGPPTSRRVTYHITTADAHVARMAKPCLPYRKEPPAWRDMARIISLGAFRARLRTRAIPVVWLETYRRFWGESLDRLTDYLDTLSKERKMSDKKDLNIDAPAGEKFMVLTRTFNAPRSLVWKALSQPEHIIRWWGPHGHANKILHFDWRVGGSWRIQSSMADGMVIVFHGDYREIEPEWKTVQTFAVEGMYDGAYSVESLTLEEVDGKTLYKVVSELPDVAARDGMLQSGMEVGVVEGFERLDAILEEFKAGDR
ncbi:MAG: hypothetical protein EOP19_00390 [Hyphomicrobiales bacterium]|nr:MAG: hypothetical protein EOP19_00390 [Hyphomicrobiales bacterium]